MKIIISLLLLLLLFTPNLYSITLDEAIKRGLEVSLPIKEQKETIRSSEYQYNSTLDPYLPKANIQTGYTRYLHGGPDSSSRTSETRGGLGKDIYNTTTSLSYRLYDGGQRSARRQGSISVVGREKDKLESVRNDILFNIKTAFFTALGKKSIVEKRKEAYETSKKILELTKARYEAGVAKKSDVLQSEVRLSSSKIELFDAQKDFEKAIEDLNSLLLFGPDDKLDVEGNLASPSLMENIDSLVEKALRSRPDVNYQLKEIERLDTVYQEKKSEWYPKLDAELQQSRLDKTTIPNNRQDTFGLTLTYPLFDGVGRLYNMKAAASDVSAAKFRLEEIKRNVRLEITKAYKDYELSMENIRLYSELLREADTNFEQAFGEYKVGRGDILTLLQAEKDLARARENLVASLYQANNALAYLKKVAYLVDY